MAQNKIAQTLPVWAPIAYFFGFAALVALFAEG